MIHSIVAHEVQGLLYVFSACLIFLIVTPKVLFENNRRKILFVGILILLTYFYIGYEDIDPFIYMIHLAPVSLALATLFEGIIPGIATWAAFNFCSAFILSNDPFPLLVGSTLSLLIGLIAHYREIAFHSYWHMGFFSALLITVHLAGFFIISGIHAYSTGDLAVMISGTYVSSLITSYVYYNVKNQERLLEELINAEKYQMIGQLAASISHEVRNPLTTTHGFLQLMGRSGLDGEQLERYRQHAMEGIEKANAIISDYLNYAKPVVEEARPIDVKQLIDDLASWIGPYSSFANIQLSIVHRSRQSVYIMGESRKLQQCLINIMKNAVESMPQGGKITITTQLEEDSVQIAVQDTGIGMNEFQLRRIGMPFFTTKERGTGLGLMVVLNMIQAMDGKVKFDSKPDQGTTCTIHFKQCSPV
ncbi:ATP-binding protein [Paenibacillus tarimensis]